ncbi:hypothetical protein OC861_001250 [Tilletia horrida]|nr:hypothetical protein OC845_001225 [Tilletia horrida]KAK0569111.1 hypothetical protein OC861_001250 [Tilletia horrida]
MRFTSLAIVTFLLGLTDALQDHGSQRASARRHHAVAQAQQHEARATLPEARYGLDRSKPIRGVNLGNWLITESWMMPQFYFDAQTSSAALVDEYSWIKAHSNRQDAYDKLRSHYSSYMTEDDFKLMQAYGLNAVRIPVPYWTLEDSAPSSDEIYFFKGGRPQLRQALLWCKKYGIDVVLDLHAAPGSQNAYDNSGSRKGVFWQTKQSYYDRTITALTTMVDFYVNNQTYGGVVKAIITMNEPLVGSNWISLDLLQKFNKAAYRAIRGRVSAAKGAQVMPTVYFSNSIIGTDPWMPWIQQNYADGTFIKGTIGFGEMSDGVALRCVDYRDCVGRTMQQDINTLNTKTNNYFARRFWEAQRIIYEQSSGGWFFWSWKTVCASAWSYRDSVQQVWLPQNPNERVYVPDSAESAAGQCVSRKPNRGIAFRTTSS